MPPASLPLFSGCVLPLRGSATLIRLLTRPGRPRALWGGGGSGLGSLQGACAASVSLSDCRGAALLPQALGLARPLAWAPASQPPGSPLEGSGICRVHRKTLTGWSGQGCRVATGSCSHRSWEGGRPIPGLRILP